MTRQLADTPATLFGSWWHTFFQHFPWKSDPKDWPSTFEVLQSSSPDPERSTREWGRIAETLREAPQADVLRRAHTIVHTEFPFLWRFSKSSCLEGVIDLLAVDAAARKCLLIDWKTNRLTTAEAEHARVRYLPQIAAYWQALTAITQFEVEAALFSTALGVFLPYEASELAAAWERLRPLSPDHLQAEMARAELALG